MRRMAHMPRRNSDSPATHIVGDAIAIAIAIAAGVMLLAPHALGADDDLDPAGDFDGDEVANEADADARDPCVPAEDAGACDTDGDNLDNDRERALGTNEDDA